jgi:hypothetical protein
MFVFEVGVKKKKDKKRVAVCTTRERRESARPKDE